MMWEYNMAVYLFFLFAIIAAKKLYDVKHNKFLFITANVLLAVHAILEILMFTQPWINAYKTYIFG